MTATSITLAQSDVPGRLLMITTPGFEVTLLCEAQSAKIRDRINSGTSAIQHY